MRAIVTMLVLCCLAASVWADHTNTDIHWPGWRVESSEELYLGKKYTQYPLTYLFDGEAGTAWVFSGQHTYQDGDLVPAKGAARRVVLTIRSDAAFNMDSLRIMNGYNKSEEVFARNDRITGLRITLSSGEGDSQAKDSVKDATLQDRMGWHTVRLERRRVRTVELEVTAFVKGPDDDICISGLELYDGDRRVEMNMPVGVLASDGDECGCGYESHLADWHGKAILPDELGRGLEGDIDLHFSPSWRLVAFRVPTIRKPTLCIFDAVARKVILTKALYWHTIASVTWVGADTLRVQFPPYEVGGKAGGPQKITFTPPADALASSGMPRPAFGDMVEGWKAAWAEGKKARTPKWADGREVLVWPSSLPADITAKWAKEAGLIGRSAEQIVAVYGKPDAIIENESVGTRLYVYAGHSVSFHEGRCDGCAPRSANFEKWFAQPDI